MRSTSSRIPLALHNRRAAPVRCRRGARSSRNIQLEPQWRTASPGFGSSAGAALAARCCVGEPCTALALAVWCCFQLPRAPRCLLAAPAWHGSCCLSPTALDPNRSKEDGKLYVIKEVDISNMPPAEREAAHQEAKASPAWRAWHLAGEHSSSACRMCTGTCAQAACPRSLCVGRVPARVIPGCHVQRLKARLGAPPAPQLLMALDHPNVVRCYEAFVAEGRLHIVMDYCTEGGGPREGAGTAAWWRCCGCGSHACRHASHA